MSDVLGIELLAGNHTPLFLSRIPHLAVVDPLPGLAIFLITNKYPHPGLRYTSRLGVFSSTFHPLLSAQLIKSLQSHSPSEFGKGNGL
jgi:hypothetical protein